MNDFFNSMFNQGQDARHHHRRQNEGHFPASFNVFDSAFEVAATAAQHNIPQQELRGPPPAGRKSIRHLPTIRVRREDLVDENNRECCICFEEHDLGDKVTRLSCAHIYHPHCITEWLKKHCTCPVCRYELPTDNSSYEQGRMERMSQRKPRYAQYELERMSMKELKELCKWLRLKMGLDKREIISQILNSGRIDVIVAPNPVEYNSLDDLRSMGVGQLKKAMSDAGVFFDPKDVVEKDDMVQIFFNSGRIVLLHPKDKVNPVIGYGYADTYWKKSGNGSVCPDSHPIDGTLEIDTKEARMKLARSDESDYDCQYAEEKIEKKDVYATLLKPPLTEISEAYASNQRDNSIKCSSWSVKQLRQLALDYAIDISDCIEKSEMLERLGSNISQVIHSSPKPTSK